jgi:hypothetical protein
MEVGPGVVDESAEEVFEKFGLQIADESDFDAILIDERGTSPEIDRDDGQRFIHGQHEISRAIDAFAISESLGEQLANDDACVFDGVMLIDIEVASGGEFEIEGAVFGEQLQHVVKKSDASRDFEATAAVNAEFAGDLRFFGVALELSCSDQWRPPVN